MAATEQMIERVKLVYQSAGDNGNRDIELPFRLLVLGDFSADDASNLFEAQMPIGVNQENINRVLAGFNLELVLRVQQCLLNQDSDESIELRLPLHQMSDFTPDGIVAHVPELKSLCQLRTLFSDIQDQEMEQTGQANARIQAALSTLNIKAPARAYLEAAGITCASNEQGEGEEDEKRQAFDLDLLGHLLSDIDHRLGRQVDAILHHPDFIALESAWRSLHFLVNRIDFRENCRVEIINVSKDALIEDFEDVPEIVHSRLYELVYTSEFGQFGGQPYAVLIGNYDFGPGARDMRFLQQLAALSSMSHAPFIAAAGPTFFDVDHFSDMPGLRDLEAIYNQPHFSKWHAFRHTEDARYVGLTLPGFLLRQAYKGGSSAASAFEYHESFQKNETVGLWGNSAFPFTTRLAASFAKTRWCNKIAGEEDGRVSGLHLDPDSLFAANALKIPTQILISDRRRLELVAQGFTPLSVHKGSNTAAFYSGNSVIAARKFAEDAKGRAANLSHQMGAQFQYLFMTCRIAHYLKMMQREHIGAWRNKIDIEQELNHWLRQYVSDMDNPTPNVRVRRPFRRAKVSIRELETKGDWYLIGITITPHIKFMGSAFALSETGKLDKG